MSVDTFGIEKEFLHDLLRQAADGRLALPEFQRGWVWPYQGIASLLASISLGYPVGTVMMLQSGGEVRFKTRPIEGAPPPASPRPERLLLDGQQRLTSLFQSLVMGGPVQTQDARKKPVSGWFSVDVHAALDPGTDREDAIRFLPSDRTIRNFRNEVIEDYSTPEAEYANAVFPLHRLFDPDDWAAGFQEYWDYDREKIKLWNTFNREFVKRFEQYQVPVIELGRATPRQAVCQVFEKVNTGGVTLTVFELLTATYAADEFDLRRDWDRRRAEWAGPEFRVLQEVENTDFLQAVTLLATRDRRRRALANGADDERAPRVGCRRSDMLGLGLAEYQEWAPEAVRGFKKAARFLHQQFFFDTRFLPYGAQLIPLAAVLAVLGQDSDPHNAQIKLARWFWCGVFGELYGGTTETRFARDVPETVEWLKGGSELPRTVLEAQFDPGRLLTLRTRGSAAYKGIYALLLKEGAVDWRTGEPGSVTTYFDDAVDIHHVFPRAWCEAEKVEPRLYNSVINKTALSARTNRIIGGHSPSEYLRRLANSGNVTADAVDKHIETHLIDPALLREDDFPAYFAARQQSLLQKISAAIGKPLVETAEPLPDDPTEDDDARMER